MITAHAAHGIGGIIATVIAGVAVFWVTQGPPATFGPASARYPEEVDVRAGRNMSIAPQDGTSTSRSSDEGESPIVFVRPSAGDLVSLFADVEYEVRRPIPKGYRALLLVRDPLGQYWSWGSAPSGTRRRVQFGVLDDTGKDYEVVESRVWLSE
jgi:hypothetical protein